MHRDGGRPVAPPTRARVRLPTIRAGAGRIAGRSPTPEAGARAGTGA